MSGKPTFSANAIVTAMVAVSFGSYASAMFAGGNVVWVKVFAVLIIVAMTAVNVVGSNLVARAQTLIVYVVLGILSFFAVVTLANANPSLLAPSGYPPLSDIISSVALTFFAFLGFGIITFTAKDLAKPAHELPRAMYLALGIATIIYIAIALGVFGTLTVEQVVASGGTALAVAAEPTLGSAGYTLMSVTALFATAGATNAGLYPAPGLSERLAETGQFPPLMARRLGGRVSSGLLIAAAACVILALFFALGNGPPRVTATCSDPIGTPRRKTVKFVAPASASGGATGGCWTAAPSGMASASAASAGRIEWNETIPQHNTMIPAVSDAAYEAARRRAAFVDRSGRGRVVVSGAGYIRVLIDEKNEGKATKAIDVAAPKQGAQGMLWEGDWLYYTSDNGLVEFLYPLRTEGKAIFPTPMIGAEINSTSSNAFRIRSVAWSIVISHTLP
jgi:hypothetical protein